MSTEAAARTRILLVDDSVLMRKAASKMLGEEFDVVVAKDGQEAWVMLQADPAIQLVFTDLNMPKVDGYELVARIRGAEDEGTVNMPVIVVTGAEDDEGARRRALDAGATDFVTKPFTSIDLLARARAHANYRRITRQLERQVTLDALTGLLNKAGFLDRAQQDLAYMYRHGQPLSLVRIEVDDFRSLFLKFGKAVAEEVVQQVAKTIRRSIREEDSAGRIGLSGFALCLPAGQHEGSKGLVDRIRQQIALGEGNSIAITVSAAVLTPALDHKLEAGELLAVCDDLLQEALAEGGNRVAGRCDLPAEPETEIEWAAEPAPVEEPGLEGGIDFDVRQMAALLTAAADEAPASAQAAAPPPEIAPEPQPQPAPAAPVSLPTPAAELARAGDPAAPAPATMPAKAPSAPSPAAMPAAEAAPILSPASAEAAPVSTEAAKPASSSEPMGLDLALDLLGHGQAGPVVSQLPQLIRRLLPLFRLLGQRQRAQLIAYLQKLG
jgi:two-component system, cell cycle response regulator